MLLHDPLFLTASALVLVVAGILIFGIGTFAKGGEFNRRNANRIMRWRIYMQAVAVGLVLLYVWLRRQGG